MEFRIARDYLNEALGCLSTAIERKHQMNILSNVKVEMNKEKMTLTGSDLEIQTIVQCDLTNECIVPGITTIPFRKLLEICKSLPPGSLLDITVENNRCILKSGQSRFSISTLDATDYPLMNKSSATPIIVRTNQGELKRNIDNVMFSMAVDDVRYYLTGALFDIKENSIKIVTTDGHRLSCSEFESKCDDFSQFNSEKHIILPRKAVHDLSKQLDAVDKPIELRMHTDLMAYNIILNTPSGNTLHIDNTILLLDAKYPNYNRVIPKDSNKIAVIDTGLFKAAMQRVAILSNEKLRIIKLTFTTNLLRIDTNNSDKEEAFEEIPIKYASDEVCIGFNAQYLIEIMSTLNNQFVEMYMSGDTSSTLVKAIQNEHTLYVVMPVRV